jgi:hypothetical protein
VIADVDAVAVNVPCRVLLPAQVCVVIETIPCWVAVAGTNEMTAS